MVIREAKVGIELIDALEQVYGTVIEVASVNDPLQLLQMPPMEALQRRVVDQVAREGYRPV